MSNLWPPTRRRAKQRAREHDEERERARKSRIEHDFQQQLLNYASDFDNAIGVIDSRARALTEESLRTTDPERVEPMQQELAELVDQKWQLQTAVTRLRREQPQVEELQRQAPAPSPYAPADTTTRHAQRVDILTLAVAFLLVAALFLVIFLGIFRNMSGEAVAQAAAPIAGLAGIAVGFLFSDRRSRSDTQPYRPSAGNPPA
jgi:hypothetical protein